MPAYQPFMLMLLKLSLANRWQFSFLYRINHADVAEAWKIGGNFFTSSGAALASRTADANGTGKAWQTAGKLTYYIDFVAVMLL